MARPCSYTKRDLQIACSRVKRKVQDDIKLGSLDTSIVNKTYLYNEIGKKLKLRSGSAFHKPAYEHYEYLNNWYNGVAQEIEKYCNSKSDTSSLDCNIDNPVQEEQILSPDLSLELQRKNLMIEHLNKVIRELRMENETLRLKRISRLHNLDTDKGSDILDESIDSNEIKALYELISNIYNATFNEKDVEKVAK